MRADSAAAAHMANHKIEVLVPLAAFLGEKTSHGFLVERVEYRLAGQLGEAGDAGVWHHFIHHHRIGDI